MFPEGNTCVLCFEIPARSLQCRLGHAVTTYRLHQFEHLRGTLDLLSDNHRAEKLRQRRPGGVRPFLAVKRAFAAGALAPAFAAVGTRHAREDDAAFSGATEAGFEKVNERQANLAQFNRLNKQSKKVLLRGRYYALSFPVDKLQTSNATEFSQIVGY